MAQVLAFQPYKVEEVANEWTPTVQRVVDQIKANAALIADGKPAVDLDQPYIGCADDKEAKAVMNKIARAANALGYGARKRYLGANVGEDGTTVNTEFPVLLIAAIGAKKVITPKTAADAISAGKGTK